MTSSSSLQFGPEWMRKPTKRPQPQAQLSFAAAAQAGHSLSPQPSPAAPAAPAAPAPNGATSPAAPVGSKMPGMSLRPLSEDDPGDDARTLTREPARGLNARARPATPSSEPPRRPPEKRFQGVLGAQIGRTPRRDDRGV